MRIILGRIFENTSWKIVFIFMYRALEIYFIFELDVVLFERIVVFI